MVGPHLNFVIKSAAEHDVVVPIQTRNHRLMLLVGSGLELDHFFGRVVLPIVHFFVEEVIDIFLLDGVALLRPVALLLHFLPIQAGHFILILLETSRIPRFLEPVRIAHLDLFIVI